MTRTPRSAVSITSGLVSRSDMCHVESTQVVYETPAYEGSICNDRVLAPNEFATRLQRPTPIVVSSPFAPTLGCFLLMQTATGLCSAVSPVALCSLLLCLAALQVALIIWALYCAHGLRSAVVVFPRLSHAYPHVQQSTSSHPRLRTSRRTLEALFFLRALTRCGTSFTQHDDSEGTAGTSACSPPAAAAATPHNGEGTAGGCSSDGGEHVRFCTQPDHGTLGVSSARSPATAPWTSAAVTVASPLASARSLTAAPQAGVAATASACASARTLTTEPWASATATRVRFCTQPNDGTEGVSISDGVADGGEPTATVGSVHASARSPTTAPWASAALHAPDGGITGVSNSDGGERARFCTQPNDGTMGVGSSDGDERARFCMQPDGGIAGVSSSDGGKCMRFCTQPNDGTVGISNSNRGERVLFFTQPNDGTEGVSNSDGVADEGDEGTAGGSSNDGGSVAFGGAQ
ncbi:hypothetical protein K438DRAFT_1960892 [Mycena galopus ATCC 62051]|nr:hypothetical protein K438DRAFT_1960892 [Mycena galopus ATCC 62051]